MKMNNKIAGWFCVLAAGMMVEVSTGQEKTPAAPLIEGEKITFETKDGRKYEEVTIKKIGKASILIRHDSGLARITYTDLPEKLNRLFGVNEKTAKVAAEEMRRNEAKWKEVVAARSRKAAAVQAARNKEWEDKQEADKERAKAKWINYKVSQVVNSEGGVLARKYSSYILSNYFQGRAISSRSKEDYGDKVFIVLPSNKGIVDGAEIKALVVPNGIYSYNTVLNARASVVKMKAFEWKPVIRK